MSEDWHTADTGNEIIVPVLFGSKRPRIWLRRCRPEHRPIIREYILNRGTQAGPQALAQVEALYAGGPVAVP